MKKVIEGYPYNKGLPLVTENPSHLGRLPGLKVVAY
jgi:hypothetical protein